MTTTLTPDRLRTRAIFASYAALRATDHTWLDAIRTLRTLGVSLADAKAAHDRYTAPDPEPEPRECDKCGDWTTDTVLVTIQTCRQTHWSPAEYDDEFWCQDCRERAEYEHHADEKGWAD